MDVRDIPSIELLPFFMHEKHYGKLYSHGRNFSRNERAIKMEHIIFFKKIYTQIYICLCKNMSISICKKKSNFSTKSQVEYNFVNERMYLIKYFELLTLPFSLSMKLNHDCSINIKIPRIPAFICFNCIIN